MRSVGDARHGVYDDFVGYRVPGDDELSAALRSATVVVDTNVLFNLYRRSNSYRDDLFAVLERLGDRLFVPHQVLREYWRNRLDVIADRKKGHDEVVKQVGQHLRATSAALQQWAQSAVLSAPEVDELTARVDSLAEGLRAAIAAHQPIAVGLAGGPATDPVLRRLEALLDGRVGAALPAAEWEDAVRKGAERVEKRVPPGYRDADKVGSDLPEGASGDYLFWSQAITEVTARGSDLVLVTDDQKEDWWLRHQSTFVGPRPELVAELDARCGARLFLLRTSELLQRADSAIDVPVRAESVEEARRSEWTPWTADAVGHLLTRLDAENLPQADVIRRAARLGGSVDRAEVYDVCGFSTDRLLTGFTKPVARITWVLQYEGLVPQGVPPALYPVYEGPGRARAFVVPDEIVDLLATADPDEDG